MNRYITKVYLCVRESMGSIYMYIFIYKVYSSISFYIVELQQRLLRSLLFWNRLS